MARFTFLGLLLPALVGCATLDEASTAEDDAALESAPAPAFRRELRLVVRNGATNDWLATAPSSLDGQPIGTGKERVSEIYARVLETLRAPEHRPGVLGLQVAFAEADAALPLRAEIARAFTTFPAPLALADAEGLDPRFRAPHIAVGHDKMVVSCSPTPDGTCARGALFVPLDLELPPFAAALVAAVDAVRANESAAPRLSAATARVTALGLPFVTRDVSDEAAPRPGRTRMGLPYRSVAVIQYGYHEVLTSARVRADLAGRVVVLLGQPGPPTQLGGPDAPAEPLTTAAASNLANVLAAP